jgi:hypothetical protein
MPSGTFRHTVKFDIKRGQEEVQACLLAYELLKSLIEKNMIFIEMSLVMSYIVGQYSKMQFLS